jgi:hypothetical protein
MNFLTRLTLAGYLLLLVTILATVGWYFLVDDWYRERDLGPNSRGRSYVALLIGVPVLFFCFGSLLLIRLGISIIQDDLPADADEQKTKDRRKEGHHRDSN